jgi:protein SCO1/2
MSKLWLGFAITLSVALTGYAPQALAVTVARDPTSPAPPVAPTAHAAANATQTAPHLPALTHGREALPAVTRTTVEYQVPAITLVRDDGKSVSLRDELNDGRPVVLNFIYTTCSGICPLASHTFSLLQRKLGAGRDRVHLVSISIDPEEDTPARLRAYARRYSAGSEWQHYSGTAQASIAAQRAFDVYRGDKMGHTPATLVRTAPGAPWVRFDGFATADMLLQELQGHGQVTAAASSSAH